MAQIKQALLVDDDEDMVIELESVLVSMGFKVTTIQDPEQINETLGVHQYQLALVNKPIPEMGWRKTLRTVKMASRSTTVIMITRHAQEEDIRNALSAGAYLVMQRPISQEKLANLIAFDSDELFILLRG